MTKKLRKKKLKQAKRPIMLRVPVDEYHKNIFRMLDDIYYQSTFSMNGNTPNSASAICTYLLMLGARAYRQAKESDTVPECYLRYDKYLYDCNNQLDAFDASIEFKTPYKSRQVTSTFLESISKKYEDATDKERLAILKKVAGDPTIFPPDFDPLAHLWDEKGNFVQAKYDNYIRNMVGTLGMELPAPLIKQIDAYISTGKGYYSTQEAYLKELRKEHKKTLAINN